MKSFQDISVLVLLIIMIGFLGSLLHDIIEIDTRFAQGFLVGAIYYDFYKKKR